VKTDAVEKAFLVFGAPAIEKPEIDEVVSVLESGWLGTGPRVAKFERDFARYKGSGYPVALNSCTAALHLSLLAADLREGDEVITSPMTFCATANAILHAGAVPVLADVDPRTMNIDPEQVEAKITPRTKALLPVHFAGRACEMDALMGIAASRGLTMIEDCAHAIETEYHGRKVGTFGEFGCFSFYVTKNVATGEGGMVLTKREEDAARIKVLGLHGMSKDAWKRFGDDGYKHYQVVECGFKYNMMDLQAAIGIHQLGRVEENWKKRQAIWRRYNEAFAELPIALPAEPEPDTRHAFHLYTVLIDEGKAGITRDQFLTKMTQAGIGVGVHYVSLVEHPYYQQTLGWSSDDCPHAVRIGRQTVSLPISPKLTEEDVERVIGAVRDAISRPATKVSRV
jgi:dTDP-4-amino-4,6-dideoxygalactose transaminase